MSTEALLDTEAQDKDMASTASSKFYTATRTLMNSMRALVGNDPHVQGRTSIASSRLSVMSTGSRDEISAWVSLASAEVYQDLPEGSFSEEVAQHILATKDVDIATCLGPIVPSLRLVSVIDLAAMICFFPITYFCTAYNSAWLLKYIILLPFVIYRFYVEWHALQYFIPPYVYDAIRTTDSLWPVLGMKGTFQQWRVVELFFSVLGVVDNFLDTGFAASTVFVIVNDGGLTQAVYEKIWGNFWISIGLSSPQFVWSVILMWLCTLALPIAHLLFTIPRGSVNYSIGDNGLQFYLFQRLNFAGVSFFLSASSNMSAIQSLVFRQGSHELYRLAPAEMISYVQPMAVSMLKRVCYSYLLRNSLQINVQTLIFSIHMHSGTERTQTQTAVSMAVGIIMALKKLSDVVAFEKYVADAKSRWASDEDLDKYIESNPENHLFRVWKRVFWKMEAAIRFAAGLTALMLVIASVRLFMASFICESHLFEILNGCIE